MLLLIPCDILLTIANYFITNARAMLTFSQCCKEMQDVSFYVCHGRFKGKEHCNVWLMYQIPLAKYDVFTSSRDGETLKALLRRVGIHGSVKCTCKHDGTELDGGTDIGSLTSVLKNTQFMIEVDFLRKKRKSRH